MEVWYAVPVFVLIGIVVAFAIRAGRRRHAGLQVQAEKLGFQFVARQGLDEVSRHAGLRFLDAGQSAQVSNVLTQTQGQRTTKIFDFAYSYGKGKTSNIYAQTVLVVEDPGIAVPTFFLSPESYIDRIREAFGAQDIDFKGFPEFSRRYLLQGDDEQAIRNLFSEDVLSFFAQHRGWWVEGRNGVLVAFQHDRSPAPEAIGAFLDEASRVVGLFEG